MRATARQAHLSKRRAARKSTFGDVSNQIDNVVQSVVGAGSAVHRVAGKVIVVGNDVILSVIAVEMIKATPAD